MKISIIIPVFNVEQYIEECLHSVKNLNLDYELIIVNDGSTDSSLAKINDFSSVFTGSLEIINKDNGGQSSARNAGIKKSTGDYLFFLDSDDFIDIAKFEIFTQKVFKDNVDIGFADCKYLLNDRYVSNEATNYRKRMLRKVKEPITGIEFGELFFDKQNNRLNTEAAFALFKGSFLRSQHILFKEGIYHEDTLFTMKCICLANRVKYYDVDFYTYRIRMNSTMTTTNIDRVKKRLKDKEIVALELYYLKERLNISKFFIDSLIIDIYLYSIMERKISPQIASSIIKNCKKKTFKTLLRVFLYKIMQSFYKKE